MKDSGKFRYRKHNVEYKISNPMSRYPHDWRIQVNIRIDNGDWIGYIGIIPVRLPDIKRMVRSSLIKSKEG